jgi:hypothetical protein
MLYHASLWITELLRGSADVVRIVGNKSGMSYVRLNITDAEQTINGEVHGYLGDAVVAALTAEPETVEELGLALARFVKPQSDGSPFAFVLAS